MTKKEEIEQKRIKTLKQKSRDLSIKEGIYASAKGSFGTYYLTPFAIAINSSNSLVAIMSSITGLLGPMSQIFSSRLIEKKSRKKIVTKSTLTESFTWIGFLALGILFSKGIIPNILPILFITLFAIYTALFNAMIPAWFSWTGDIISERYRGRWISKRNLLVGFTSLVLTIGAAFFLQNMKDAGKPMLGFEILFFLAFVMRILCWKIFKKQYEPKMEKIEENKKERFSFFDFIIKAPKTNFGKFSLFRFFFSFSVMIANSLISVYLLRYLNLKYPAYIIIVLSATFFTLVVTEMWGKIADKYGNYKVLAITTVLIPIVPILWIINSSIIYLILVPGIVRGIAWAGFKLSEGNFIYDNVSKEKRGVAFSYYNMMMGLGIFFGGLVGAFLIKFLNTNLAPSITIIFIISSILSMIMVSWWIPKIKEVRKTNQKKNPKAFRKFLLKQIHPTINEEVHQIISIKRYINKK
jgi:MFS family permease